MTATLSIRNEITCTSDTFRGHVTCEDVPGHAFVTSLRLLTADQAAVPQADHPTYTSASWTRRRQ